ncbi:alpha-ketoglutarate-dependent dioxygenase AlkB family protein [Siphonobacter sp.]|uniref:alpha-ketoglutarate-dependent dioxygenase AlkB family protein n=1 Tax=Siphonobacter sp. TaxID=1869184 RepID=UPI003B3BAA28
MNTNQLPNLLPFQGEAFFYESFFSSEESDALFQQLYHEIPWKQEPIRIFGKEVMQPRLTAWAGDPDKAYTYSGITMQPTAWTPALRFIKDRIDPDDRFTNVLLNLYRDGQDAMGWHRDNEKMLGTRPVVASVSLGGSRIFQFRHYTDKKLIRSVELTHGSLLLMQGETQHYWEHRIPRTNQPTEPRINLTFRTLYL